MTRRCMSENLMEAYSCLTERWRQWHTETWRIDLYLDWGDCTVTLRVDDSNIILLDPADQPGRFLIRCPGKLVSCDDTILDDRA